jgi:DNA-binding transcriptional MocR family regulator
VTAPTVSLTTLSPAELAALRADQQDAYDLLQARGLSLDLTRGKPSPAQLDLSDGLLELPGAGHKTDASGTDVRNYGGVQGLKELRGIFAELLNVPVDQLVAGDNASLAMMHDVLVYSLLKGNHDSDRPWAGAGTVKFLCPSPGYDRHFALCAQFGIEMIPVALNDDGPDVAEVAALVASDPSIKGMWIVPTYANPTGSVVSDEVARGLASMPTAATDFRIFWDNAYAVHHLTEVETPTADILRFADEAGNPDRVYLFASTSKITFAGAGVCFFGGSDANVAWYLRHLAKRTIGPDKVNQLRHAMFPAGRGRRA